MVSYFKALKITYLILIHLFPKNRGGRRNFIFISYQDTRKSSIWGIFSRYLVKGRYCARAIAIKFIEAACKIGTGGDENQVSYFIWPYGSYKQKDRIGNWNGSTF